MNYALMMLMTCGIFTAISCKKGDDTNTNQKRESKKTEGNLNTNSTSAVTTLFGASSAAFPDEPISGIESWDRLNNRLKSKNGGIGLAFRRSYGDGIPASFAASNMADDVGRCDVSIGEIKPSFSKSDSENYNLIRNFVLTIPVDRKVYLVYHHEPESKVKRGEYTTAQFTSGFVNFVRAVISVQGQRPNVHPCLCLMSYTFNPVSGRNPEDYRPTGLTWNERSKVVAGVDGYADDPTESASSKFNPIFTKMGTNSGGSTGNWGFTRFGIFETAAHGSTSNTQRQDWVSALGTWAKNHGNVELVSWFNSGFGDNAGPTGWYLGTWGYNQSNGNFWFGDGDGSLNAYAQVIK